MTPESPPSNNNNNNNTNNEKDSTLQHFREHQENYHDLQEDEEEENEFHKNSYGTDNSRVLFVFNLTVDTREEDIMKEFSAYGKVESVKIVMDRKKLINRGFCFVTMSTLEEATRLREAKIMIKGQSLHIEKAARTEGHNSTPGQGYQGKRTPRERLMPKSLRDKDHPRSRGGRDNGRGGGRGKGAPFRQRGGHTPKGGRLPPGSYLPPQSGQPPYDYYNYGYYGYPPYGQFPPPPGTPPLSEEHPRGGSTSASTSSTSGGKDSRPFSNPPYSGYPPGAGYPPYSGYPPGAYGYPPGAYGYYPPYGPNGNYDYPPYTPPPGTGREQSSPGSSRPTNRISSPSRTHPQHGGQRYFSSGAGSNYRYNPYPSVSEGASGGVPSGPLHQPPSPGTGADYESPPTNYGVYGENQPWINK